MSRSVVVVATDGGVRSDNALRFAVAEAGLRKARLVVIIAYNGPIDPDADDFETPKAERQRRAAERADGALSRALRVSPVDVPPHDVIADDTEPSSLVLRTVGDLDRVELVVVGQDHRHVVDRLLHGPSPAGVLTRRSHVPVAVVPTPVKMTDGDYVGWR